MKKVLTNDFSWSKSRHEKFSDCRRAYYFHYYQSWGGWELDAQRWVRQLYVLKKLNNRYTWSGGIVHAAIRGVLMAIRHGRTLDPARVIDRVHNVMRHDWVFSRSRNYWRGRYRKEFQGLVEHEYAEEVEATEWKRNWDTVRTALTWFFSSNWPNVARSLRREQWLEVDLMDFDRSIFYLDGVKIFAVPDFAYVDHDGATVIVDWKTGRPRDGYDDQILGYAMYMADRYRLPLARMRSVLVYLNDGVEVTVPIDPSRVDGFKAHFSSSVAAMRELLLEPHSNTPLPENSFPMTDDLATCARCVFRRPCERERAIAEAKVAPKPLPTEPSAEPTP